MKNRWLALLTSCLLAVGATLAIQGTATAVSAASEIGVMGWPTGCSYGKWDNGAWANCSSSNGGHYRARVICTPGDGSYVHRAPETWVSEGGSYVWCPPRTGFVSAGIETKAS